MTDYISNPAFVEVLDPIPLENIGWEVHAVSPLDWVSKVAVFPYWKELSFTKPVSDPGYGKLVVSSSDERLQTDVSGWPLEDTEVLLQVFDEGVLRFDFLASKAARPEDKPDVITMDGKGTAQVLERAICLPSSWPTGMGTTRSFTATRMSAWLTLLDEAQLRGVIPQVIVSFTGAADTAGLAWPAAETFDINVGDNLYDMLTQFCELYNATWVMRPGFHLDIYQIHGNDRRDEVIWHLGGHTIEHSYERDRSAIATNVYSGTDGVVVTASDFSAETRWGKREAWISAGDAKDSASISRYASRNLELLKDQKKVRSVTVPWKAPKRRVFVDWNPGDIVSVETLRDGVEAVKITAVSVQVDEDAQTTIEITISDDPTAAMPFEARVAQQSARDGSRATSTRASKKPQGAGNVVAGTGITGGGSVAGAGTTVGIDLEWFQDQVGAMMEADPGLTVVYDDITGKVKYTPSLEWLQDNVAAMLVAGSNITLTYNDGTGQLTIDASGGGGGGSGRPPLDLATLHGTYGDDFDGASLNARWTRLNLTSGDETYTTTDDGWLNVVIPGSGAVDRQYHQAAPAGDFSIIMSMVLWGDNNSMMFGPMVIDSSGTGIAFTPYNDNNAYIWNLSSYAYSSTGASMLWGGWQHMVGEKHWVRLRKSGTTYYGSASRDGHIWSKEVSGTWAGTVNRIGFGRMFNNGTRIEAHIDRFNVV